MTDRSTSHWHRDFLRIDRSYERIMALKARLAA
jgi:hypothetical protein